MRTGTLALLVSATLALAACSSSPSSSSLQPLGLATPKVVPTGADTSTVDVASSPLGKVLVDQHGKTLYEYAKDKTNVSTCNADCEGTWPALAAKGKPSLGPGIHGTLGAIRRHDGVMQVTLDGHPLYTYAGDQPGDINGEGLFNLWYAVSPTGTTVKPTTGSSSGASGSSSSSGGSGRSGY